MKAINEGLGVLGVDRFAMPRIEKYITRIKKCKCKCCAARLQLGHADVHDGVREELEAEVLDLVRSAGIESKRQQQSSNINLETKSAATKLEILSCTHPVHCTSRLQADPGP